MKDAALYLEVDEDITSAIDKLSKTDGATVQIVVPKRSTMLQSIINLKLLKKAAADSGKELVLVTGDKLATDLAGRVGLAVAPSLGAKAVVAEAPAAATPATDDIIEEDDTVEAPKPEPVISKPVPTPAPATAPRFERREVDAKPAAVATAAAAAAETPVGGKTPRVPNFNLLKRRLLWAGLAVVLVAGYLGYMALFAGAKVTLYAAGNKVQIDTAFAVDTSDGASASDGVMAGQKVSLAKDASGSFAPTGQKDVGTKASGQMTVKNEYDSAPHTLAAGTRFAAPDGKVFRTNDDVTVPAATPVISHGQLSLNPGSVQVAVTADQNGDSYNEAPARYTIVAYSGDMQAKIYGQGGQMSGGTSKVVTVVTQADIDKAKADLLAKDKDDAVAALQKKVPSGYRALSDSVEQTAGDASSDPALDEAGTTATLKLSITYNMVAVKSSDFTSFIRAQEQSQIGSNSQIYDDGLGGANITSNGKDSSSRPTFKLSTQAYSGVKLDTTAIAEQMKGKKYGDAVDIANKQPGVQRTDLSLSPAWATGTPRNAKKIKITIQVASDKE